MWTVIATRDFQAAQGARVFAFAEGEVIEGSLAEYLYATGAPVSPVTDLEPDDEPSLPTPPTTSATAATAPAAASSPASAPAPVKAAAKAAGRRTPRAAAGKRR